MSPLIMRSEWLQQQFPDVYEAFYLKHDLVVSVPHTFRWSSSITSGTNSPSLKQALPIRLFLWVTQTQEPWVHLKNCYTFDQSTQHRQESLFQQVLMDADLFATTVAQLLQKMGYKWGITMEILSEVPRGQWFGFRGGIAATTALAIMALTHSIDDLPVSAPQWKHAATNKITRYLSSILDMIATQRTTYSHHAWLLGESEPMIYRGSQFPAETFKEIFSHAHILEALQRHDDQLEKHMETSYTSLSKIACYTSSKLPFDYAIVYLWQDHESSRICYSHQQCANNNEQLSTMASHFSVSTGNLQLASLVNFDSKQAGNYCTFQQIVRLSQLVEAPYDQKLMTQWIQSVIDAGRMHSVIEKEHHILTELYHRFGTHNTAWCKIGMVPLSSAKKWWCVLMVMPYEEGRHAFEHMIEDLKQTYPRLCVNHQSWRDTGLVPWPQINQFLSKSHFAQGNKEWKVLLRQAWGAKKMIPYTELKWTQLWWVVLDAISGKVLIDGKKLTHKDLITQSGTVEVMTKLLEHPGKYIHHAEFPLSSYTRNKNEMLGKVVTPLKELIKKHYAIDLPIICDGTTYDFHICLEHDAGLFHVIQKPFLVPAK